MTPSPLVYVALTGERIAFPTDDLQHLPESDQTAHTRARVRSLSSSLRILTDAIERTAAIPKADQILLYDGRKLDDEALRESLTGRSRTKVLVFDRRQLLPAAEPPAFSTSSTPPVVDDDVLSSAPRYDFHKYNVPMLAALSAYGKNFAELYNSMKGSLAKEKAASAAIRTCTERREVQHESLSVAMKNVNNHFAKMKESYFSLSKRFESLKSKYSELIDGFDDDVQALRSTPLHSQIQAESKTVLGDCVPLDKLVAWSEQCKTSFEKIDLKFEELSKVVDDVFQAVNSEVSVSVDGYESELGNLNELLSSVSSTTKDADKVLGAIRSSYDEVVGIEKALLARLESGEDVLDTELIEICGKLGVTYTELKNKCASVLSDSQGSTDMFDAAVNDASKICWSASVALFHKLRTVSALQSRIRDIANRIGVFKDAIARQKDHLFQLQVVHRLRDVYSACLVEVVRRRAFQRNLKSMNTRLVEEYGQIRQQEVELRDEFIRRYGRYIPKDLISGLGDRPPHLAVKIPPFDEKLPDINELSPDDLPSTGTSREMMSRHGSESSVITPGSSPQDIQALATRQTSGDHASFSNIFGDGGPVDMSFSVFSTLGRSGDPGVRLQMLESQNQQLRAELHLLRSAVDPGSRSVNQRQLVAGSSTMHSQQQSEASTDPSDSAEPAAASSALDDSSGNDHGGDADKADAVDDKSADEAALEPEQVESKEESEALARELEVAQTKIAEQEKAISNLQQSVIKLSTHGEAATETTEVQQLQRLIKELTSAKSMLETQLTEAGAEVAGFLAAINDCDLVDTEISNSTEAQQWCEEIVGQLAQWKSRVNDAQTENERLREQVEELSVNAVDFEKNLERHRMDVVATQEKFNRLQAWVYSNLLSTHFVPLVSNLQRARSDLGVPDVPLPAEENLLDTSLLDPFIDSVFGALNTCVSSDARSTHLKQDAGKSVAYFGVRVGDVLSFARQKNGVFRGMCPADDSARPLYATPETCSIIETYQNNALGRVVGSARVARLSERVADIGNNLDLAAGTPYVAVDVEPI